MLIKELQKGPFITYNLIGYVFTIGSLSIDLDQRQTDSETIIDITRNGNVITEGYDSEGEYVANIQIPPKKYNTVQGVDGNGDPVTNKVATALKTDDVKLTLWQFKPIIQN